MNGIMQDIGRGTHQARRRALHVPPAVPRRPDRAARRRGRLRGADGDRHSGDPRSRADREHRRRGADLHQPAAAAGAAVVHRRQRKAAAAQPARRSARRPAARAWASCGRSSTASRRAAGRSARSPCRRLLAVGGLRGQHQQLKIGDLDPGAPELRADLALQPGQRLHHRPLRAVLRPVRGDREDRARTAASSTRRWSRPTGWRWALRQVPGVQTTVSLADAARQITAGSFEGNPKWLTLNRNQDVLNYAAQQASVNNPGPLQHSSAR